MSKEGAEQPEAGDLFPMDGTAAAVAGLRSELKRKVLALVADQRIPEEFRRALCPVLPRLD